MASLIIVSNRLPVSVRKSGGKLEFYPSVGGLATGLASYTTDGRSKWIGWPGLPSDNLTDAERKQITARLKKHHCYPVFLTQKQLDQYYNGYSNSVLWPLFHHLAVKTDTDLPKNWQAYQAVNALFADEVLALSEAGSTIWVHDYQLLLVPKLLRHERPGDSIGFFLHIPFPAADTFTEIQHAGDLVQGMLGADLIGFHTSSYTQNFLASCQVFGLGIPENKRLVLPHRVVRVTEFPMGIDYAKFVRATRQRAVRTIYRQLAWKYRGQKVIVTVDRLDPTKGLAERLEAYEKLLESNAALRGHVTMVMLAVPSRAEIDEYKALKARVEGLVQHINHTFGTKRWQPVDYHYESWPF
jgi:trehalose 6-phosphate synthase/phosphatase